MLDFIRKRIKGFLGYLLLGAIILTFALWGVSDYLGVGDPPLAAKVNGDKISEYEIESLYQRFRTRPNSDELLKVYSEEQIKQQILKDTINERLLLQTAADNGFSVSKEALVADIRSNAAFHENGQFSAQLFRQILLDNGVSENEFFNWMRKDALKNQMTSGFDKGAFVTDAELSRLHQLLEQKRTIGFAVIDKNRFIESINISDEEAKAYYEQHQDAYMSDAKVRVRYIELKKDDLLPHVVVTDEEIKTYYLDNPQAFILPETRTLSHILITEDTLAETESKSAKDQADELYLKLKAGDDFAALAKAHSQDTATANSGGQLGTFTQTELPEGFAKEAFAIAEVGQFTLPIKTDFGWHIIRLDALQPEHVTPQEDAYKKVSELLVQERAADLFIQQREELASLAFENPDDLESVAETLSVPMHTSEWFTPSKGNGLFSRADIREVAFTDAVLEERLNSDVIEVSTNQVMVLRLHEHQPETLVAFEEVSDRIKRTLTEQAVLRASQAFVNNLKVELAQGLSIEKLSETHHFKWNTLEDVTRSDQRVAAEIRDKAFKTLPSEKEQPSYEIVSLADGSQSLLQVLAIKPPENTTLNEETKSLYKRSLQGTQASLEYQSFEERLNQRANVSLVSQ